MRLLRLVPLLALPLLLLGATCVTKVEQKGPSGPWAGEVTNVGSDPAYDVSVFGMVIDSGGNFVAGRFAETCPFDLLPDQKGYFMTDGVPTEKFPNAVPPLEFTSVRTDSCRPHPLATDVTFRVVETSREHNSTLVEMRNESQNTYYDLKVCGALFNRSGGIQEIGRTTPFSATTFRPGEAVTFPITFNTAMDGPTSFAAKSAFSTYQDVLMDASHFEVTASRVVETGRGRELQVVGEVRNHSALDLGGAKYEFYLQSSPFTRASGWVASLGTFYPTTSGLGAGFIPAGQKAPVVFRLPLDEDDSARFESAGFVAGNSPESVSRMPVTNVSSRRVAPDVVAVTATLTNPFNTSAMVPFFCFELRGAGGRLVGASCISSCGIKANQSWTESRPVFELAPTEKVEVVAYGRPGVCTITPPSDPPPHC